MLSYGEQHWRTKIQSPPDILARFWETEREKESEREIMRGKKGKERPRKLKWKVVKLRWVLHFGLKYFRLKQMEP